MAHSARAWYLSGVKTPRAVFALSLLLAGQLLLAVCAPALVVCEEAEGGQSLELSFTGCCEERVDDHVEPGWEASEDCGGCEDGALVLSLQRETRAAPSLPPTPLLAEVPAFLPAQPAPILRARATRAPPTSPVAACLRTVVLRL